MKYNVLHLSLHSAYLSKQRLYQSHRNVSTTQIYAELVSEKKRESANKISLK